MIFRTFLHHRLFCYSSFCINHIIKVCLSQHLFSIFQRNLTPKLKFKIPHPKATGIYFFTKCRFKIHDHYLNISKKIITFYPFGRSSRLNFAAWWTIPSSCYILSTAGRIRDFHLLETCAARRTTEKPARGAPRAGIRTVLSVRLCRIIPRRRTV